MSEPDEEPPPQPLVITDLDGRVLAMDAAARDLLAAPDAAGESISNVLPGALEVVDEARRHKGTSSSATVTIPGPRRLTATALAHERVVAVSLSEPAAADAMRVLRHAARPFDREHSVQGALRAAIVALCRSMGWAAGEAWLLEQGRLYLEAWAEREPGRCRELCEEGERLSFRPGEGLPGRAVVRRSPVWMRDIQTDPTFVRRDAARRAGLHAAVAVPLIAREEDVVAVLTFYLPEVAGSDEHEVDLLAAVARELGAHVRRLAAEVRLRRTKDLHVDLYEKAPVAYFTVDPEGILLRVNARATELTGRPMNDLVGSRVLDLYADTPRGRDRAKEVFARFVHGEDVRGEELELRHADGHSIWITLWVTPVFDFDGRVVESRSAAIDVTREHEARAALMESEERFRMMIGEVEEYAIYFLDTAGRVSSWNRGAARITGYAKEDVIGKHISTFYPRGSKAHANELLERARREGRVSAEGLRLRKDGSKFPAHVVITALRSPAGALRGFCKITRDLTQRVRNEQAVQRAKAEVERKAAELERSNRDLAQFAYVASHDLQEPLRMVSSYCEILADRYAEVLDEKGKKYLGFAVDGAQRMQAMVHDLLLYSRVGTRGEPFARMDLGACVRGALRDLEAGIAETGARVEIGKLPRIVADRSQLRQVFVNLIGNAVKFHKPDEPPVVEITARRDDDAWTILVRDNGIGMDPADASRLFVPFRRLHARHEYPGTGIGLSICRRIVERRGGRIWVESEPGKGATFLFTVPDAVPEQGTTQAQALPGSTTTQERVTDG